jgi:orotate phosphoribosyltransferase
MTDHAQLFGKPTDRGRLLGKILDLVAQQPRPFDAVVSADTRSLFLSALLAQRLGLRMAYFRPKPKDHGRHKQIEGVLQRGDRVILVLDPDGGEAALENSSELLEANAASAGWCLVGPSADAASLAGLFSALANLAIPYVSFADLLSGDSGNLQRRKNQVAEILLDIGAVTINRVQPFRYVSGILSPIYTDNRLLIGHPAPWKIVTDHLAAAIQRIASEQPIAALVGTATAGIPHAALVADQLALPFAYVVSEEIDGKSVDRLEGDVSPGGRVVVVEDNVTTGRSVLECVKALRDHQLVVEWCVSIFTYDQPESRAAFAGNGLRFEALSDLPTVLEVALARQSIDLDDRQAVLDWFADPRGWTERAEPRLV